MKTTVTTAVPEAHIPDANHLAMAIGQSPADGGTYQTPSWQDAAGNLYAVSSGRKEPVTLQSSPERPEWDDPPEGEGYTINMTGAERAQALLVLWSPEDGGEAPQASPEAITVVVGLDGLEALAAMGLTRVPMEDDL